MTLIELYNLILHEYGERRCWISELAALLGICKRNAQYLTYILGYRRGRAKAITSFSAFAQDAGVQAIHKCIKTAV